VAAAAPTASAPAPADHAPVLPARAPLNPADVSGAQALLKKLGQDPGPIDGILGPRTAAAIRGFQKAERLTIDGTLNAETRAALTRD
jgi:peptidoglycan hydrolase-like protein with peptidoglycan-binding domain